MSKKHGEVWINAYANDNTALIPEVWAQESLMFLENNMVACMLVHRDFENEVARFGQVVNTRRPAGFTAVRKVDGDDVTVQDATATNVPIRMDQHWHTSFLIYDGEESKSMKDLIEFHAGPALSSIAQAMDQTVLGEIYQFMGTPAAGGYAGKLGTLPTDGKPIIAVREELTKLKCPMPGRRLLVTPDVEGALLAVGDFVNAHTVGDDGSALREGHLGRKYGFDTFTSQNVPSIAAGNTVVAGTINNGNLTKGSTVLTVAGFTGVPDRINGSWVTIAGDATPQRITAHDDDTHDNLIQITVSPGLRYAIAHGDAVRIYTPGRIDGPAGGNYSQYHSKALVTQDFSVAPRSGQLVAFGTAAGLYGTVGVPTTTSMTLNRSLDAQVNHEANVNIGPAGEYCFGFHKNAIALVTRPLALPRAGTGVRSAVASYNGLSIRATMGYNMTKQATQVTLDLLAGVKTLDTNLGAVMFA